MARENPKIGIIGAGKLGSSVAATLHAHDHNIAISSRRAERRDWLRDEFPNADVVDDYTRIPEYAKIVFITTTDSAIKEVCDSIDWTPNHWVIHCSGVLTLNVLETAKSAGAFVAGFHPLQTFPIDGAQNLFEGIAYAIDCQDDDLHSWLQNFARNHKSHTFAIEGETAHAAYHASAVLACGLLAGLIGISAELWESAGIERDRALKMLSPMLQSTIDAITRDGLPDAISGPYVRGDLATIRKHLQTTAQINPDTSRAYAALALAQIDIANEKGNLNTNNINAVKHALTEHLKSL